MNPWGVLIAIIGVVLIIAGVKGSYPGIETALTGKKHAPPGASTSSFQATPPQVMVPNKPNPVQTA